MDTLSPAHIVVDWGTSSFRLWALDREGRVLGERRSHEGLAAGGKTGFENVLESHIAALGVGDGVPAVMCGMVGSRNGWLEAAYLDAPVRLDRLVELATAIDAARRPVRVLPGIAQRGAVGADVMRGEETQLLALAAQRYSGLACLPGTHSKWVRLEDGAVEGFSTYMTGELFQLMRTGSVIAPATEGGGPVAPESAAFAGGVTDALDHPERVTRLLFGLRAGWLLAGTSPDDTLARLSGLLIGIEIAGAAPGKVPLALVASGPTAALYSRALALAGIGTVDLHDAETCVRQGLHAAASRLFLKPSGAAR